MHVHILGICGTFMGGVALLARQAGHRVTGCDQNIYPPMSTHLQEQGIDILQGYDPAALDPAPDLVVIGNALSRGNRLVEHVLDSGLPYTSGPNSWPRQCCPGAMCWLWPVPTVKPVPPACWPGSWTMQALSRVF